jgi:uncharacterized membrane protein YphA (DoxX/SURF4 family)
LFFSVLAPATASAHVKWFSNFSFADLPMTIPEVLTPTFIALAVLSTVALAVLVLVDRLLTGTEWYERISNWFSFRSENSHIVMRIGLGATLLMAWQADSLLVPRLPVEQVWLGWLQFLLIFFLFFRQTTPLAGWGTAFLYVIGVVQFGWFYMLDYVLFIGVAFFLIFDRHPSMSVRGLTLPALYFTTGFSLIWVGLEKLFYPQWGLYILQQNPQLALGFPIDFFLVGAAFVELVLGYLLIIGLLERPLALLVTLVFFMTTMVFGKVEVIGHTIVHASLVVFLLEGPGDIYKAPITFHRRTAMRMAFASVNFVLVLGLLFFPYAWGAHAEYEHAAAEVMEAAEQEIAYVLPERELPSLDFSVSYDPSTSWLLNLDVSAFEFVQPQEMPENVIGEGHAFIYVDGQLVGLAFSETYQLKTIAPGTREITVTLHANDGSTYTVDGEPLSATQEVEITPRDTYLIRQFMR